MKAKKDPRDVTYNFDGVNYVGSYDSKGNYHPPCRPPKNGCSCEPISYGMKLRNKKTGEICEVESRIYTTGTTGFYLAEDRECDKAYNSLAEFNDEWEDYEEPKERWFVGAGGEVMKANRGSDDKYTNKQMQSIGNYFKTKEEAEKVVEKLKAWKRLRDKGFKFYGIKEDFTRILQSQAPFRTGRRYLQFNKSEDEDWLNENWDDLSLVFGEEEE